mgnify:CR=1 FL=1
MKKFFITLVLAAVAVANMNAMSISRSSREARFLTDKMAWELGLNNAQIEDIYEINFDYFRSLANIYDNNMYAYEIRNEEISYVLSPSQWIHYKNIEYFYTPVCVQNNAWTFSIYVHYDRNFFYFGAPAGYRHYNGGHAHNRDFYMTHVNIHLHDARPVPAPHHKAKPAHEPGRKPTPHKDAKPAPRYETNTVRHIAQNNVGGKPQQHNVGKSQQNRVPNNAGMSRPKNDSQPKAQAKPQTQRNEQVRPQSQPQNRQNNSNGNVRAQSNKNSNSRGAGRGGRK